MQARDIEALVSVSTPTIAPDATHVVVSVAHPSLAADANVAQLWSVPLEGAPARRLTRGRNDSAPAFSPDGRALAFVRAGKGSPGQLFVMPAEGGEPFAITDAKLGVGEFRWTPDSHRIVYTAAVAAQGRYGTVEGIPAGAEPGRHITDLNYKRNGSGYTGDQRSHVFVVEVPDLDAEPGYEPAPHPDGSKPESPLVPPSIQLTDGPFTDTCPRVAGERVLFVSARHDSRDRDLVNQVFSVGLDGSGLTAETELGALSVIDLEPAADGSFYLSAQDLGEGRDDFVGTNAGLYLVTGGLPVLLTDPEVDEPSFGPLTVVGHGVLTALRSRGRGHLHRVDAAGAAPLTSGDIEVLGQAAAGGTFVVTYASPETFGDVALVHDGTLVPLTDFGVALRSTGLVPPVETTVTGRDGYPVHGWVARPAGEGPHPVLLMIHGGPYSDYGVHAFDETQVYVDAGYAVVFCNPRGSAGYGQAHGRAIKGDMGGLDTADVLDFLEGALNADEQLDATRLGILGGSYGGYLTAWIIAHDDRFGSAVVERGYLDPPAFIGSSDIGSFFPQQYNGADRDRMRAQSPQEHAHRVMTPTFVIHSEDDLRCPIAQAETYFATLKLQGVHTEMLVFPGENHELTRSGRPRHRVQRFEAILDWFGRTL